MFYIIVGMILYDSSIHVGWQPLPLSRPGLDLRYVTLVITPRGGEVLRRAPGGAPLWLSILSVTALQMRYLAGLTQLLFVGEFAEALAAEHRGGYPHHSLDDIAVVGAAIAHQLARGVDAYADVVSHREHQQVIDHAEEGPHQRIEQGHILALQCLAYHLGDAAENPVDYEVDGSATHVAGQVVATPVYPGGGEHADGHIGGSVAEDMGAHYAEGKAEERGHHTGQSVAIPPDHSKYGHSNSNDMKEGITHDDSDRIRRACRLP